MYDHLLRRPKEILLIPVARRISLNPNTLTGLGLLFGLCSACLCSVGYLRAALFFWVANRIVDGLDGEVARVNGSQTDFGGYLDIMCDLLVYAFLPLGLAIWSQDQGIWLALALMLSSFYINVGSWMYLSSILEKNDQGAESRGEKTTVSMPRGLVEGGETVLIFTLFFVWPQHLRILYFLFAALTFLTAFLRVRWAQKVLHQPSSALSN